MCRVKDKVKTACFGDARLNVRMEKILRNLGDRPARSLPQALGGWAETITAYRFFDNDKATFERFLNPTMTPQQNG